MLEINMIVAGGKIGKVTVIADTSDLAEGAMQKYKIQDQGILEKLITYNLKMDGQYITVEI